MPPFVTNSKAFTWRLSLTLLIGCLLAGAVKAEEEEPVAPAQIAEWIAQLDDDLYATRKSAQQGLERSGLQALEATAEEAQTGSLESSTGALNVMLTWSESTNHELQFAALKKLIALPNYPVESGLAAEFLADSREQVALEAFSALGGGHQPAPGLPIVKNLPNLQVIIDSKWKGELAGLKHLTLMRRATWVSFYVAPVDEGVLGHLVSMPNLRRIEFYGTKISTETLKELEKQIPNIVIDVRRSAAFLGIGGTQQGPVRIAEVKADTAAQRAGLRRNDTILELDGEQVKDFRDLTQRISQFQPGDTVELTILRAGKQMKVQVTFDRWKKSGRQVLPPPRRITLERR